MGESRVGARGDRRERARGRLRQELVRGESVLAEGTAHWWYRERAEFHAYLFVTPDQLLWTDDFGPSPVWTLPFTLMTGYLEEYQTHRYILRLMHSPVERLEHGNRWRFLWWTWGNAERPQIRTGTTFMFSRRDTAAAVAIRHQLSRWGVAVAGR
jgi:hypothetical protein